MVGAWADGLLIAGDDVKTVKPLVEAFRAAASGTRPIHLQLALSYAPSIADAEAQALDQWAPAAIGGEVNWDLRRPADFDRASRFVRGADMRKCVLVTDSLAELQDRIAAVAELGIDVVQLHQVGANQEQFIDAMADLIDRVVVPGPRPLAGLG
jgi:coenzyme F420-dependent glucose-6-phosphate dehydrogenase